LINELFLAITLFGEGYTYILPGKPEKFHFAKIKFAQCQRSGAATITIDEKLNFFHIRQIISSGAERWRSDAPYRYCQPKTRFLSLLRRFFSLRGVGVSAPLLFSILSSNPEKYPPCDNLTHALGFN
jgi:hypothetical protein